MAVLQNSHQKGFTLIEIAIVLAIVGLILGSGLFAMSGYSDNRARYTTEDYMDKIRAAVHLYVLTNRRLPCPSDDIGGAERANCNGANAFGILPWQTLRIRSTVGADGWRNMFSYAVDPAMTAAGAIDCTNSSLQSLQSDIEVRDSSNTAQTASMRAGYVVISHGANQLGALSSSGTRYATDPHPARQPQERQNSYKGNSASTFYSEPIDNTGFDDFIIYESPVQILRANGCTFKSGL